MRRERKYYYEILGLRPGASNAEVKSAYRSLVKLYHPDRDPSLAAEVMYNEIRDAYNKLLNWDNSDRTRADPIYQPPKRATQTTSGSQDDSKRNEVWDTDETSMGSNYRVDEFSYSLKDFFEGVAISLSKLTRLEIFIIIAVYGFLCIPIVGSPYTVFAVFFYVISWIIFVIFRYYIAFSFPPHRIILIGICYGYTVGFLVNYLLEITLSYYVLMLFATILFLLRLSIWLHKR
ncbi:MAG: DnaJ domain-containing protein [Synergistaceae bacterium]|nr:DnaJ domain-containing protein [Synergistaceae bacterium]